MSENHDSHAAFLPRPQEQETPERLDALLDQISQQWDDPRACATAVAEHVATLVAGIAQLPDPGRRPRTGNDLPAVLQWLELELGDEIDRFLRQLWNWDSTCLHCNQAWTVHLLDARATIGRWASARELQALLPPDHSPSFGSDVADRQ